MRLCFKDLSTKPCGEQSGRKIDCKKKEVGLLGSVSLRKTKLIVHGSQEEGYDLGQQHKVKRRWARFTVGDLYQEKSLHIDGNTTGFKRLKGLFKTTPY